MGEAQPTPRAPSGGPFGSRAEQFLHGALVVLSVIGIGITDFSAQDGRNYWLAMVPLFAGVNLFTTWSGSRKRGEGAFRILRLQVLHWLGLACAVGLIYAYEQTGQLSREGAGLVALLSLALATFLAGVHTGWPFMLLGGILAAAAAGAALIQQFFWILLLPVLLVGGVLVFSSRRHS